MRIKGLFSIGVALSVMLLTACEKEDTAIQLPAPGEATYDAVDMGEDYEDQLFYDFETGKVVHISLVNSWDLAFDASPVGFNIFMNGGADVLMYNTHKTNINDVTNADDPGPISSEWMFDAPSLVNDSTYVGDWRANGGMSKNEVYIVKLNNTYVAKNLKKIQLVSVSSKEYVMVYADLDEKNAHTISIPKDDNYNYSYFSFTEGGQIVQPDPPKYTWDIVFTRYRHVYRNFDPDFPYTVSGALLNPYNTTAMADSVTPYQDIKEDAIAKGVFVKNRNIIGFDWKDYDKDKSLYTVFPYKCYVIKNRLDHYWKLHFLDFYNKQGQKGSPSFEYQRLQ